MQCKIRVDTQNKDVITENVRYIEPLRYKKPVKDCQNRNFI